MLRVSEDEFAAESTLFSLTTEVPRPTEKRTEERFHAILPVTKLVTEDGGERTPGKRQDPG